MSIHVSITRRADPGDTDGPKITPDEWLAVASGEPYDAHGNSAGFLAG